MPALAERLWSVDVITRGWAAHGLGRFGDKAAHHLAVLREVREFEEDKVTRQLMDEAIEKIGKK
jgi:hypothetical protein